MPITQAQFVKAAGAQAVVWVDPVRVTRCRGSKWPVGKARLARLERIFPKGAVRALRPWMKRREPFITPAELCPASIPMVESSHHRLVADFVAHRHAVTGSAWYRMLLADLARHKVAHHKSIALYSEPEIADFLEEYSGGLVASLERDGFQPTHDGFSATAVIDRDGALCKTGSGNHRFALAQVLGLSRFPLRIVGCHGDWARARGLDSAGIPDLLAALEEIRSDLGAPDAPSAPRSSPIEASRRRQGTSEPLAREIHEGPGRG